MQFSEYLRQKKLAFYIKKGLGVYRTSSKGIRHFVVSNVWSKHKI